MQIKKGWSYEEWKKLTVYQRNYLHSLGLNPNEWLLSKKQILNGY
ncbi:DUF6906 family protein [Lysinibacillus sphaericus]